MIGSSSVDWLIVGLGNPGRQYERTRHNCGFRVLDTLGEKLSCRMDKAKFQGLYGTCTYQGQKLILLKPQTYMNLSGVSAGQMARFYKLPPERVIVVSDDISLEPGRMRVRANGSAGGHNGLKNLIAQLGSQNFPRVKIGVGAKPHPDYELMNWVLGEFSAQDEKALDPVWDKGAQAVLTIVTDGVEKAANRFNGK